MSTDSEVPPLFMLKSWCELDGLTAGFTTRQAGNAALHVGDMPQAVIDNRRSVMEQLGWGFEAFTCAEQVHGSEVHIIAPGDKGRGRSDRASAIPDTDALITNESNVLMAMYFADCVPLYFYDPVSGSMGLAHAGWKGTIAEIAVKTVEKMQAQFGVQPANLLTAIGPSIGSCCYEVDQSVLKHVVLLLESLQAGNPSLGASDIIKPVAETDRAMLDLKHLNRHLMIKAGILPSRIEMSTWCTGCRTDLLFSHRMEKGATGRMMSWLGRKSR
ncbi:peptidoglycan editing factor PgeF [Cohnella luojiensis]|uniref:peptidoglycan editing factor PgeF n=1 Tax=Cohnella luojiensis TaxID=652876 RepID=UPI001F0ECEE0|nr:peptidoglycan editing factor PgeF [Cohnella luojiensis]